MQRNAIVGFNTFLFPLLRNYAYHVHNYVKRFLPFKRRLAAGVLSSLPPSARRRRFARALLFSLSLTHKNAKLRWLIYPRFLELIFVSLGSVIYPPFLAQLFVSLGSVIYPRFLEKTAVIIPYLVLVSSR